MTESSFTMIDAINNGLDLYLEKNKNAVLIGEDIGFFGGVFRVTKGLQKKYGAERVIDSPLSESGIIGTSIGMALGGLHPIAEIQFADFVYPGYNQIINEMAKYRYRSGNQFQCPMMVRMPYGGGIGGGLYHSQSPESLFTHIPGLRVVIPSSPKNAKGLLLASLESADPVIFFEPKKVYRALKESVSKKYYTTPLDTAFITKKGTDITLLAYGAMSHTTLQAADLAKKEGIDCEVIDLTTLIPLDTKTIINSVKKTKRLIVIHEAPRTCGFGAEIAAIVQEKCFKELKAPVHRVTGYDTPFPFALENHYLPSPEKILYQIKKSLKEG